MSEAIESARPRSAPRVVETLAFPAALVTALFLHARAIQAGADPLAAGGAAVLGSMVFVALLERLWPHHRSWLRSHDDVLTDVGHALTIGALSGPLVPLVGLAAARGLGAPTEGGGLWPVAWSWWGQLPLALAVAELPKYCHHRLQHTTDFFWRFHALHHSAPRLYFLNAARFHPIDIVIDTFLGFGTLYLLGCPLEVIALFSTVSAVHGYFQHANLKIRIGPLNYVFSMAELHRWHHSKTIVEANHNYGQNVILWDLVFGTFFWPDDREPPEEIGIAKLDAFPMVPAGTQGWRSLPAALLAYLQQLASPFTWGRIKRESGLAEGASAVATDA